MNEYLNKEEVERIKNKKPKRVQNKAKRLRQEFLSKYDHRMQDCIKCNRPYLCAMNLCIDCYVEEKS